MILTGSMDGVVRVSCRLVSCKSDTDGVIHPSLFCGRV